MTVHPAIVELDTLGGGKNPPSWEQKKGKVHQECNHSAASTWKERVAAMELKYQGTCKQENERRPRDVMLLTPEWEIVRTSL